MSMIQMNIEGITNVGGREFKFVDIPNVYLASGKMVSLAMFTTEGEFNDMIEFIQAGQDFFSKEKVGNICAVVNSARLQYPQRNKALVVGFVSTTENITQDHHEATILVFTALQEQYRDKLFVLFLVSCEVMMDLAEEAGVEQLLDREN